MALSEGVAVRLTTVEYGVPGINLYRFSSLCGEALPDFEPGAHIDLHLESDTVRQYSLLWPAPCPSSYLVAVQLSEAGKGGSRKLHYESVVGASYQISPPRNHFPLVESPAYCLLAGGIGITPIISMYRQLRARNVPVQLYYWTTAADHVLFAKELASDPQAVHLYHTREGAAPPRLKAVIADTPKDVALYCCGPAGMIDEFDQCTADRPAALIHRERFSPTTDALQPGDGFQVQLKRAGLTLTVAADQTLLEVCEAAGVEVPYSCEEGICGACEITVLAGEIEHRDSVLSAQQRAKGNCMMACCSRGVGNTLIIDL